MLWAGLARPVSAAGVGPWWNDDGKGNPQYREWQGDDETGNRTGDADIEERSAGSK